MQALGRVHDADEARRAAEAALMIFGNVNFDLMYGLPQQTLPEARADLSAALAFMPPHLSFYHLTLEPNTLFHRYPPQLPDDDAAADIEDAVHETLAGAGYQHYETSAYAKAGRQCAHNANYWRFGDYLGIGAGAHSKLSFADRIVRQLRWKQPKQYLDRIAIGQPLQEEVDVTRGDVGFEFMLNALRLTKGVPSALFAERTGYPLSLVAQGIEAATRKGLLEADPTILKPTELGRRFLNDLQALFLTAPLQGRNGQPSRAAGAHGSHGHRTMTQEPMTQEPGGYTLTLTEAAEAIAEGQLTSVALATAQLTRVRMTNAAVEAWVALDPDRVQREAARWDEEPRRGPLGGIGVGVKDIIATADLPTEMGSPIFADHRPQHDATCVARLGAAGAFVFGKTVTTPFAFLDPGKTRNPWDPAYTPGGSSSGSAAAVAVGHVAAAIGTQHNGSVIRPAAYCGVVGFKPTCNAIPIGGVNLFSETLDTVGTFTRTVEDAARLASAMADPGRIGGTLVPLAKAPRFAYLGDFPWVTQDRDARAVVESAVGHLRAGAEVVPVAIPVAWHASPTVFRTILLFEAARNLGELQTRERARMPPAVNAALDEGRTIARRCLRRGAFGAREGDRVLHAMARGFRCSSCAGGARSGTTRSRVDRGPVVLHVVVAAGLPGHQPARGICRTDACRAAAGGAAGLRRSSAGGDCVVWRPPHVSRTRLAEIRHLHCFTGRVSAIIRP